MDGDSDSPVAEQSICQTAAVEDLLDSFNLNEPPPLDWRSDTSSEVEDLDAADFPSCVDNLGVKVGLTELAPPSDGNDTVTPVMGTEREEEEVVELVVGAEAAEVRERPTKEEDDGDDDEEEVANGERELVNLGVGSAEAVANNGPTTDEDDDEEEEVLNEDQELVNLGVGSAEAVVNNIPTIDEDDEEEEVLNEEEEEIQVSGDHVLDRRPRDEDHTHIHALLNRLQQIGEEPASDHHPSPLGLAPLPHHIPSAPGLPRPSGPSSLHYASATKSAGLLFSESHQRDLLGLLECTEIRAPTQHASPLPQASYLPSRGEVDAVVSVSYSQDDAHEFWRHYRKDWRLPSGGGDPFPALPEDELSEPVWMKRELEEDEEEEDATAAEEESEDYHPAYKDVPGPCDPEDLIDGIIFGAKYLGSTQIRSDKNPSTNARMTQAQEAVDQIKAPEGESQPMVEVDLFISTQRIKVLNADTQEAMMDHSLQMISYIADINNIVVLMARRKPPSPKGTAGSTPPSSSSLPSSSSSSSSSSGPVKKSSMICHVFSSEDAQTIAQAIGQAFAVAYQQFLQANGIKAGQLRPGEYSDYLGTQELYNGDLAHFSDSQNLRDVLISKATGEILGLAVVESGWGSILPTVVVANLLHGGPAERSGDLSIGDRIMSVNGTSLVGLPLTSCQNIFRDLKSQNIVKLSIVHCPPVTMAIIKRPEPKFQLGFSVEDGIICSLMRGGIAERGGIRVGHRIIEINGQSVVATPHEKIIGILTNAIGEIHLKTMPASTYRLLTGQEQPLFL